jgi:YggT family protein
MTYALIGRAILSWVVNPYTSRPGSPLVQIYNLLGVITEPVVAPIRKLMSRFNTGPMDFSIFVAMIILIFLERIVTRILYMLWI